MLFPGQSTTFRQNKRPFSGKPGGPTGTNTAGKNDLLRGQNKAELSARAGDAADKMQKLPHRIFVRQLLLFGFDMYPQYWVSSIGGTYHFCLFLSLYSEQHFRRFRFV